MKTYAFELSGEHETLPRSEALALTEMYSSSFEEICFLEQCLIVKAQDLDFQVLGNRLAMTHRIIELLAICEAHLEGLAETVKKLELPNKPYSIKARRIKHATPKADEIEREIGRILYRRGFKADLRDPEIKLRAIITEGRIILGKEIAQIDRRSFETRRPHLKPFFYPGVLMPRVARALVNLSYLEIGERLLDPFAGVGGILLEACLIGIESIGVEVQTKLVRGTISNLAGLDCCTISGDAKRLPFKDGSFDGAVLDVPYGRSARIEAKSKNLLLSESLAELHRVLKRGRCMVIVADKSIEAPIKTAGFEINQRHIDRVHRSLTRHIFVCQKEKL